MRTRLLSTILVLLFWAQSAWATPVVAITTPADNTTYVAPASIGISADATSPDPTASIAQVDFYAGTSFIGNATAAPYGINWANVAAGSYSVTAIATDTLGATTTSNPIGITVINNTAPTVSISASPTNATALATVTLTATATDSDGSIAKVEFYNGTTLLATVAQAPYTYSWTNVAAGSYSVTATATDDLGAATTSSPVAVTITGAQAQAYFIQSDQLNTPRLITDASSNVVWQWDSDPFGVTPPNRDPNNTGAPFTFNPRFPGQYFDQETGLHYNYFRDYDPSTGRYIESDPIGLQGGINTYAYVGGNPVSDSDPRGLKRPANSAHCKALRDKIGRKNSTLDERYAEYAADIGQLPERISPNELLFQTRRGHRTLINMEDSSLRKLEKRYAEECEDEPPPPPAPAACPDPNVPNWVKGVGAAAAVTGAVVCALAEPCGAILGGATLVGGAAAAASR